MSTRHLAEVVAGRVVEVAYQKRDRYGRIVGKILVDGLDANLAKLEAGLAWHYKRYQGEQSPEDRHLYSEEERKAHVEGRGGWRDKEPVPPWEYRRAK